MPRVLCLALLLAIGVADSSTEAQRGAAAAIDEDTAVVRVTNVRVTTDTNLSFMAAAMSRVGVDVRVQFAETGSVTVPSIGAVIAKFPAITILLPPDTSANRALFHDLQTWWNGAVQVGVAAGRQFRIDVLEGNSPASNVVMSVNAIDALPISFSRLGAPRLVIKPATLEWLPVGSLTATRYASLAPAPMATPTLRVGDGDGHGETSFGLVSFTGGDLEFPVVQNIPAQVLGAPKVSPLTLTAVARFPGRAAGSAATLAGFDALAAWINGVIRHQPTLRLLWLQETVNSSPTGRSVRYEQVVPTRVSFINPAWVAPSTGLVPPLWHFVVIADARQEID